MNWIHYLLKLQIPSQSGRHRKRRQTRSILINFLANSIVRCCLQTFLFFSPVYLIRVYISLVKSSAVGGACGGRKNYKNEGGGSDGCRVLVKNFSDGLSLDEQTLTYLLTRYRSACCSWGASKGGGGGRGGRKRWRREGG